MNVSKLFFLLCIPLVFLAVFYRAVTRNIAFTEDIALSMAVGDTIYHGEGVLVGPPSHKGGRHLGAVGYWYVAAALMLTGGDPHWAVLVFSAVELVALFSLCLLASRCVEPRYRWWAASGVLLPILTGKYDHILRMPWHNHFTLVFSTIFLFSFFHALKDGWRAVPLYALTGTLLLQFHYSTVPLIAGCTLALLWRLRIWEGITRESAADLFRSPFQLVIWAGCAALWAPLLYYIWRFNGLGGLISSHLQSGETPASLRDAFRLIVRFFGVFLYEAGTSSSIFLLGCATGLGFVLMWGTDSFRSAPKFWIGVGTALLGYLAALSLAGAPLFEYYVYGLLPLPALLSGILLPRAIAAAEDSASPIRAAAVALLLLSVIGLRDRIRTKVHSYKGSLVIPFHTLRHAREVAELLRQDSRGEVFDIIPRSASRVMHASYMYFLGPRYFPKIKYWDWLRELPQGNGETPSLAYMVACPRPQGTYRREIAEDLARSWERELDLNLSRCRTCAKCVITRYRRRSDRPPAPPAEQPSL